MSCPVLCWLEVEPCPCWKGSLQKDLQVDAETHQEKKKERRRRRSTKNGLGRGPAPPSTTRLPSPGLDPTPKQSTPCPVPTGQCGGRGGCAGTRALLLLLPFTLSLLLALCKASSKMSTGWSVCGMCVSANPKEIFHKPLSGFSELTSHCRFNDWFVLLISA